MTSHKRYPMPIEPFQEIIEKAIQERAVPGVDPSDAETYTRMGMMSPLDAITDTIARKMCVPYANVARRVYDIRAGKVRTINFDLADAIACSLSTGLMFWVTDDRVSELYEAIA